MNAVYRLDEYPANFNFFEFLVAASTAGATHILLDHSRGVRKKYPDQVLTNRLLSIVEPGCALAGCTYEYGSGKGIDPGYHFNVVVDAFEKYGTIKKLQSVLPASKERFTVTLRNQQRRAHRNSSPDWIRFANEIGARVILDYENEPLDLHERMALYAGAEMNYFVANGPGVLCICSDYPYTTFMHSVYDTYHQSIKLPIGSQVPWSKPNQRIIWKPDNYANIRHAHRQLFGS